MSDKPKKHTMETTTLTEVPAEERKSWISVAFMQAGIMICVPSLMLGGDVSWCNAAYFCDFFRDSRLYYRYYSV